MHYWLVDVKLKKFLVWTGWAVIKGGHLRDHLSLIAGMPKVLEEIDDLRIRPIKEAEARHRTGRGIMVLVKTKKE